MNNHFEHHPWGVITYWRKSDACGKDDATRLEIAVGGMFSRIILNFNIEQKVETANQIRALDLAFAAGEDEALGAVRKALKIKEPRQ